MCQRPDKQPKPFHLTLLSACIVVLALMLSGCTEHGDAGRRRQSRDTVYTQKKALSVFGYDPVRALQIVDSAVVVGNISKMWADVNRVKILSQTLVGDPLDSLLGGPAGIRFDTARAIGERLLLHDSVTGNPLLRQDVLELLVYIARRQEDTVRWSRRSRELVSACLASGARTKALRTEAEIGAERCQAGHRAQGMATLDSVIAVLNASVPFRFNELDALTIALKRKMAVLIMQHRYAETLPIAQRMMTLLDDYEQHPDRYHDGSYREPQNSEKRADYINFYRSQALRSILKAYTALGDQCNVDDVFEKIKKNVYDATTREHLARYKAIEKQMEAELQYAEARHNAHVAWGTVLLALLAGCFAVFFWWQKRIVTEKNRYLARQVDELIARGDEVVATQQDAAQPGSAQQQSGSAQQPVSSEATDADRQLFVQIAATISSEQLYLRPDCDRQMLTKRFQLSKERLGTLFATYSKSKNLSAYINVLRLEYASVLLASQPELNVQEVAQASGFSSHQYFSRCFKLQFGLSPSDYRAAKMS